MPKPKHSSAPKVRSFDRKKPLSTLVVAHTNKMIVRVRSNVGVWRVTVADDASLADLLHEIKTTRPSLQFEKDMSFDPACSQTVADGLLAAQGVRHGTMVHCRVDPSSSAAAATASERENPEATTTENANGNYRRVIGKDGSIQLVPTSDISDPSQDKGFRKGMMALRDMKMHWTLTDFMAMDAQYEFKIKRQEKAICEQVSLDVPSITAFQSYVQKFAFQRKRFGILYGKFLSVDDDDKDGDAKMDDKEAKPKRKCLVEAIYEPPQDIDNEAAEGFVALDDEQEEAVEKISTMLGLVKVGWIFGHEQRKDYALSAAEVLLAAEYQLEAAEGVNETPFVTVTVSPTANGSVTVEAFQLSQQCMAMVAEEALEVGEKPNECVVNDTFTAIQEGKASKTVENSFFLTVVPIVQHTSETLIADFPHLNRDVDDRVPSHDSMKTQLAKSGTSGWTFEQRLADFNLLVYLSGFLDLDSDLPKICASIMDPSNPLDDGYKILIKSMAGLDSSY